MLSDAGKLLDKLAKVSRGIVSAKCNDCKQECGDSGRFGKRGFITDGAGLLPREKVLCEDCLASYRILEVICGEEQNVKSRASGPEKDSGQGKGPAQV